MGTISHVNNYVDGGARYRVVGREHSNGTFSKTLLKWAYSDHRGKECWTTIWHVEGSNRELLDL